MSEPIITRFAPSPTGRLHIGGARTALFCLAFARAKGGRFLVRVEDTDQARSSDASTRAILDDLAWLGIAWDEGPEHPSPAGDAHGGDPRGVGPFFQSQRLDIYTAQIDRLIERDLAYPAFDTPEELAHKRAAAQARKETFRYRRPAAWDRDRELGRLRAGETGVIRFHAPDEPIVIHDEVLGDVRFEAGEMDDFVIRKADGFPTYHFGVVVDDALMGVTHVLRGQEHLMNTPRHVALQRALGFATPVYAHMPLIFNPDGSKMSKRDKDKAAKAAWRDSPPAEPGAVAASIGVAQGDIDQWLSDKSRQLSADVLHDLSAHLSISLPEIDVEDFRRSGYLPEVLVNYIALLGWNPGEKDDAGKDLERFDIDYLCAHFSLDRVGKKPSKFDRDKLRAFNADRIQKEFTPQEFAARWRAWLERHDPDTLAAVGDRFDVAVHAAQPRATTLADAAHPIRFALIDDDAILFDEKAVRTALHKNDGQGLRVLADIKPVLAQVSPFAPENVEDAVKQWCEDHQLGMKIPAQALRVAMTGTTVSPGLGHTLALVGQEGVQRRIERCLEECRPKG